MSLKTELSQDEIEDLGIWQAATMDGYWDYMANRDIQYVYLLGQLKATKSIHASQPGNATRLRIKLLNAEIKKLNHFRDKQRPVLAQIRKEELNSTEGGQ